MSDEKKPQQINEVPKSPTTSTTIREVVIKGNVPRMENPPPPPKSTDKE